MVKTQICGLSQIHFRQVALIAVTVIKITAQFFDLDIHNANGQLYKIHCRLSCLLNSAWNLRYPLVFTCNCGLLGPFKLGYLSETKFGQWCLNVLVHSGTHITWKSFSQFNLQSPLLFYPHFHCSGLNFSMSSSKTTNSTVPHFECNIW